MLGLGIDYGTSTTVFASCAPNKLTVLQDDLGEDIIPSVIAFTPRQRLQIGKAARSRLLLDPPNTLMSVKRLLGKPWHDPDVAAFRRQYPYEIEKGEDGTPMFVTRGGKVSADQAVEYFLSQARGFQALHKQAFDQTIIAVPERADVRQQNATTHAALRAGFTSVDVISEPVAAVLAYLVGETQPAQLLVYDLGGGTFDAAVVRWDGERASVLSAAGDSYLGGDDLDARLATWAANRILEEHRWDVRTNKTSYQVLTFLCEGAKIRLSIAEQTSINLESVDAVLRGKTLTIEREQLRGLAVDLVDRTMAVCQTALNLLDMPTSKLDGVVLVGGSTYIPWIRLRVQEQFQRPLLTKLPADRLVAMGASVLALKRAGWKGRL